MSKQRIDLFSELSLDKAKEKVNDFIAQDKVLIVHSVGVSHNLDSAYSNERCTLVVLYTPAPGL